MAQEKLISLNNLSTFKDNVDTLLNNKDAYGVCSTAANVAAKTVSHSSFVLTSGVSISVKFENLNTAENPTLNVNGTGAKALYRFGTSKVGTTEDTSWSAGSIVTLVYDGTNWLMSDVQASANNTTYDLGVGTGSDSNKIVLTGSDGTADKVTVPYATSAGDAATVNGKTVATNVPADAVFTDTTYENATTTTAGLMSTTDKGKVDALGTASTKNVPTTGNATSSQVVMGNDTRLTDARTPVSHTHTKSEITDFPTSLPASNTTNSYSATGTVPVSGTAVAAALGTLDVTGASSIGAGKTISAWSETDGKVSISTQNISITKSQVSDFPTLGTAAAKNYTTSVTSGSSDLVTSGAVYTAIDNLPEPMVFKGSLGTGGTITALPVNGTASIGDTYKVITAGTYASQAAKVGDTFICDSKTSSANTWVLIPSGDEPSGTVTSVTIKATSPIAIDSASAITTSGTRTISHANSGATAGSYGDSTAQTPGYGSTFKVPYITVNATGHVTGISEHTVKIPASDNTNTTYTFANGTNGFTVTPSGGTAQTVTVTPSITNNVTGSGTSGYIAKWNGANTVTNGPAFGSATTTYLRNDGTWQTPTNTKNTAGSTDTSSKIFLVGATSQAANPQTYSDNEIYATSGVLTTKSVQVGGTAATIQYNSTNKCIDFVFA